jgi:thymidylate kinase
MLQRDYFFEFAGMPQSGKTTIIDIVVHFLKRKGVPFGEYRGGARYSPLYQSSIVDLNLLLASKAAEFVVSSAGREKECNKIFLLDRGLIDRCFFTEVLFLQNKIDSTHAKTISNFLMLPQLLKYIDGVFIFVTSPEIALKREYTNKLIEAEGEVMNTNFLSTVRQVIDNGYDRIRNLMPDVHLIDTDRQDGQIRETAQFVVNSILSVVEERR